MSYHVTGTFIEACDCSSICPCWLDDEPDDDHCTGLFAWQIEDGSSVQGEPVGGRTVVSVSTHSGGRRAGGTITALFVDEAATDRQLDMLGQAFAGDLDGPLKELAAVSGVVVLRARAQISIVSDPQGWSVTVRPAGPPADHLVQATGSPLRFENEDLPMVLSHTALNLELGVPGDGEVEAQRSSELSVQVAVLPAGFVDVTRRSAMRGAFSYLREDDRAGGRAAVPAGPELDE